MADALFYEPDDLALLRQRRKENVDAFGILHVNGLVC